jgi:hypothetical protein
VLSKWLAYCKGAKGAAQRNIEFVKYLFLKALCIFYAFLITRSLLTFLAKGSFVFSGTQHKM